MSILFNYNAFSLRLVVIQTISTCVCPFTLSVALVPALVITTFPTFFQYYVEKRSFAWTRLTWVALRIPERTWRRAWAFIGITRRRCTFLHIFVKILPWRTISIKTTHMSSKIQDKSCIPTRLSTILLTDSRTKIKQGFRLWTGKTRISLLLKKRHWIRTWLQPYLFNLFPFKYLSLILTLRNITKMPVIIIQIISVLIFHDFTTFRWDCILHYILIW